MINNLFRFLRALSLDDCNVTQNVKKLFSDHNTIKLVLSGVDIRFPGKSYKIGHFIAIFEQLYCNCIRILKTLFSV